MTKPETAGVVSLPGTRSFQKQIDWRLAYSIRRPLKGATNEGVFSAKGYGILHEHALFLQETMDGEQPSTARTEAKEGARSFHRADFVSSVEAQARRKWARKALLNVARMGAQYAKESWNV
jgi:glucan phosphorylase